MHANQGGRCSIVLEVGTFFFRSNTPMNSHIKIGQDSTVEAINSGADLAEFVMRLLRTRESLPDLLGSAIGTLIECYRQATVAGWVPVMDSRFPPAMLERSVSRIRTDLLQSLHSNDGSSQSEQLSFLVTAIHQLRESGCTWSITTSAPPPLPVTIVSMPDRVTSTTVQRDPSSRAIVGSTQVERDSA